VLLCQWLSNPYQKFSSRRNPVLGAYRLIKTASEERLGTPKFRLESEVNGTVTEAAKYAMSPFL
jgi:hypothetical protein